MSDEPTRDWWGGETREDRIVSAFARLEAALRARDGHDADEHGKVDG